MAIEECDGNEVFFGGKINSEGIVVSVELAARGNKESVPLQLHELSSCHVVIHNHPSGKLIPSQADLVVASNVAENAKGFYIIDNYVSDVYVVVEPIKNAVKTKIDTNKAVSYISYGGSLEKKSNHFEERPSQQKLLSSICSAFNNDLIGVFEAGTGVGKSYAYLIPSIIWAAKNKQRVVISTGTINLQQQLAEKDIPTAIELTGLPVKFILLKGRQNYVCLRRLADQINEPDLFASEDNQLERIYEWSKTSLTGSRSDLSFMPSDYVWRSICSESDSCMGMRCPEREKCFVMKIRKEATDAQLLVVNHHLLFADIETRLSGVGYEDTAVLPPYKRIIFDEAHGIEDAATSFFSQEITKFKLYRQLRYLYRTRKNGSVAGHLFTLEALSTVSDAEHIIFAIESVKTAMQELDEATLAVLDMQSTLRISEQTAHMFLSIKKEFENLGTSLVDCTSLFRKLIDSIPEDNRETQPVWETKNILRRLEGFAAFCKTFTVWDEHKDIVFYIEKQKNSGQKNYSSPQPFFCRFVQSPMEIANKMNQGVFEPMESVVCVSATLRTGRNFGYWLARSGAAYCKDNLVTADFPSPFPYKKNMLFAIPSDAPMPESQDFQSFTEKAVANLILSACGRTLVLFTSYEALRATWNYCRVQLEGTDITLLKQGDDERFRLLEEFKNDFQSVLFATDSFWEGIDVPGNSLSQVIIARLPFNVPTNPVFAARSEAIQAKGGSSFMELSVPDAVIKFRQGIGRLIRHSDDRGCVVVLDKRIIEKRYGKIFLDSIPECRIIYEKLDYICKSVEDFLF